jgi:hypothetical protein
MRRRATLTAGAARIIPGRSTSAEEDVVAYTHGDVIHALIGRGLRIGDFAATQAGSSASRWLPSEVS